MVLWIKIYVTGSCIYLNCWLVRVSWLIYSGCASPFQRGVGGKNQDFMLIRFFKEKWSAWLWWGHSARSDYRLGTLSQSDYRWGPSANQITGGDPQPIRLQVCMQGLHMQGLHAQGLCTRIAHAGAQGLCPRVVCAGVARARVVGTLSQSDYRGCTQGWWGTLSQSDYRGCVQGLRARVECAGVVCKGCMHKGCMQGLCTQGCAHKGCACKGCAHKGCACKGCTCRGCAQGLCAQGLCARVACTRVVCAGVARKGCAHRVVHTRVVHARVAHARVVGTLSQLDYRSCVQGWWGTLSQ